MFEAAHDAPEGPAWLAYAGYDHGQDYALEERMHAYGQNEARNLPGDQKNRMFTEYLFPLGEQIQDSLIDLSFHLDSVEDGVRSEDEGMGCEGALQLFRSANSYLLGSVALVIFATLGEEGGGLQTLFSEEFSGEMMFPEDEEARRSMEVWVEDTFMKVLKSMMAIQPKLNAYYSKCEESRNVDELNRKWIEEGTVHSVWKAIRF